MSLAIAVAPRRADGQLVAAGAIVAGGIVLAWLSAAWPSDLPVWAPWQFSWPVWLGTWFPLWWYCRGIRLAPDQAPGLWRRIAFLGGVGVIYAVLQTRFEYVSQHMFFLNRVQQMAMRDVGPFLIALGWPGPAIDRGMPAPLRRLVGARPVRRGLAVVQQPLIAACLFVGLVWLWLIPLVHFDAMLNARLYGVMNASMVLDGLLFWSLVLDPRPAPPARCGQGMRLALALGVMPPQMFSGALLAFYPHDLYPFYDLCGRIYPAIGGLDDQHIGGLIVWIPPTMMSILAFLVILGRMFHNTESPSCPRR